MEAALALGLLLAQLRQVLGPGGALLGLAGLRLELLDPRLGGGESLLGLLTVGLDPVLGLGQLLDQLLVALAPALDLMIGEPKLVGEQVRPPPSAESASRMTWVEASIWVSAARPSAACVT